MIKDKITKALKESFVRTINKTVDTGKEQGFFICSNKEGKLYPSKPCEGDECQIMLGDPFAICPQRVQGDFHTHPYLANAKRKYMELGKQIPVDDVLKQEVVRTLKETQEEKGIIGLSPSIPSYTDTLNAVINKCFRDTEATTCVGSDLEKNKVECWTPIDVRHGQCVRAVFELRKMTREKKKLSPKKWITPLFEKEQIIL